VCQNCIPDGGRLPRQWVQDGAHVLVREAPCSGKTDAEYLFHALEAGCSGVCVVTCPRGQCHLSQGNYRAEVRIRTMQRLLTEIGMEPERVELMCCSPTDPAGTLERQVREAVRRFCGLGESPLRTATQTASGNVEGAEKKGHPGKHEELVAT
jgi:F420-non-reducing hydrogenase iron-sulfur subunit